MPQYKTGDIWNQVAEKNPNDIFFVTANSFLKSNGELVMGRGLARVVRDRYPGFARHAGNKIQKKVGHLGVYLVLLVNYEDKGEAVPWHLFQVKRHFKEKAELALITFAAHGLASFASRKPTLNLHLNFPGIGNGGLSRNDIMPILDNNLPENTTVWMR